MANSANIFGFPAEATPTNYGGGTINAPMPTASPVVAPVASNFINPFAPTPSPAAAPVVSGFNNPFAPTAPQATSTQATTPPNTAQHTATTSHSVYANQTAPVNADAIRYAVTTPGITMGSKFFYGGQQYVYNGAGSITPIANPITQPVATNITPSLQTTSNSLASTTTAFDIQKIMDQMAADRNAVQSATTLSPEYLARLQAQKDAENALYSNQEALNAGKDQILSQDRSLGTPLDLALGQQDELARQNQHQQAVLALKANAANNSLSVAESQRQAALDAAKIGLSTDQSMAQMGMTLNQQNRSFALSQLSSLVDAYARNGTSYDNLDSASKAQVDAIAAVAGMTPSMVRQGMNNDAAKLAEAQRNKALSLQMEQQRLENANSQASQDASLRKRMSDFTSAFNAFAKNADGTLKDPTSYMDSYIRYVALNPGKGKEFKEQFPPSVYLNQSDAQKWQ
jgi:hypothetical protein